MKGALAEDAVDDDEKGLERLWRENGDFPIDVSCRSLSLCIFLDDGCLGEHELKQLEVFVYIRKRHFFFQMTRKILFGRLV